MRNLADKIKKTDDSAKKINGAAPFLVLSELNFPFIINLNITHKDHLYHHSIISSAKRRS